MTFRICKSGLTAVLLSSISIGITGCTPTENAATVAGLQSAFNTLTQNRSLAEQFVRDIKSSVSASDPTYQQTRESYDEAAAAYNKYLDQVELGASQSRSRGIGDNVTSDAQSGVTDFLASATKVLQPNAAPSRSLLRKAAPLPASLGRDLSVVSKRDRQMMVDKLDDQVRWRSWGEL